MPGRKFDAGSGYRYGFNGQEKSTEIGEGFTTAMYWEYDSRIGRRWNVDPVLKVEESPYLCFNGNPISISDVDGDDGDPVKNPKVSNDNKSRNSNRYHKVKRFNKTHPYPKGYYHTGTDIAAKEGTPINSVLNGVVVSVNNKSGKATSGYGNTIVVRSVVKNKYVYLFYGHLQKSIVKVGDVVNENSQIAISGASGNASNVKVKHVHIEASYLKPNDKGTYYGVDRINPEQFFDTQFDNDGNFSSFKQSRISSTAVLKKTNQTEVKATVVMKSVKVNATISTPKLTAEDLKVLEEIKKSNPNLYPPGLNSEDKKVLEEIKKSNPNLFHN